MAPTGLVPGTLGPMTDDLPSDPDWLVVDVMNVVGSRPDGWWHDRDGAAARLVGQLRGLVAATGREVTAVVDGRPDARLPAGRRGGVDVVHAGRGRDAADDVIAALVASADAPALVVTADRGLRERVRRSGAVVVGPLTLRASLPDASRDDA